MLDISWNSLLPAYTKHLDRAVAQRNDFHNVIWSDETTVQLESHWHFCCFKKGQKPRYKPRPKHPTTVHVLAGISWNGTTNVCILDEIINAEMYVDPLSRCLVSFYWQVYPDGHRFMQDIGPEILWRQHINWWRMHPPLPESPDANSIKNLWHKLKVHNLLLFGGTYLGSWNLN